MRKRITVLTLIIALCIMVASLTACHVGDKPLFDDFLNQNGLTAQVTYYSNGGQFKNSAVISKEMYHKPNDYIANFGVDVKKGEISKVNYVFTGWNYAQLDENNNPVTEIIDGKVHYKDSGVKANFPIQIADKQHIYLCATWELDVYLSYRLVSDVDITVNVKDEEGNTSQKTFTNGDEIKQEYFGTNTEIITSSQAPVTATNATFLQLFVDEDCTIPVGSTLAKPSDGSNLNVYAKYIEGNWTLVKTAQQALNMFKQLHLDRKYYLFNNIDMSEQTGVIPATANECKATIQGNGYKISNLKVEPVNNKGGAAQNDVSYSLFGALKSTAKITDLTIENVTINYTVSKGATTNLYAFFASFEEGATLDVEISNVTMTVKKPRTDSDSAGNIYTIINNIDVNEDTNEFETDNWMFGKTGKGTASKTETDQEFTSVYTGFKFTNCQLSVQII